MFEPNFRRVPPNSPVARFLNDVTRPDQHLLLSRLDVFPVLDKVFGFMACLTVNVIIVAFTSWCFYSSRNTLHCVIYFFLDHFITLPVSPSWSLWDLFKGLLAFHFLSHGMALWYFLTEQFIPRLRFGFRPTEIIFRKLSSPVEMDSYRIKNLGHAFARATLVNPEGLSGISELFSSRLDVSAVVKAYKQMDRGEIEESTWRTSVWLKDELGWKVWEVWKEYGRAEKLLAVVDFDAPEWCPLSWG